MVNVDKGINIEVKHVDQRTPLHFACNNGHLPIVQYLIEKGANIEELDAQVRPTLYFASNWSKHAKNNKGKMANYAYQS